MYPVNKIHNMFLAISVDIFKVCLYFAKISDIRFLSSVVVNKHISNVYIVLFFQSYIRHIEIYVTRDSIRLCGNSTQGCHKTQVIALSFREFHAPVRAKCRIHARCICSELLVKSRIAS